jgi:hypothetical protein
MERTALCFYNSGEPERLPGLLQLISFQIAKNQLQVAESRGDPPEISCARRVEVTSSGRNDHARAFK